MRLNYWRYTALAIALGLFAAPSIAADDDGGSALNWSVAPYIWAPNIAIDLTLANANIGGEASFTDILDKLDVAFMGYIEGGKGNWSAFADLTYVDASDVTERTLISISSRNKQLFLDAALAWHPGGIEGPLNIIGGVRYTGIENRFDFVSTANGTLLGSQRSDSDFYDVLVGLRYRFDFSDRWSLQTRGDASFGDTEGTLLARAHFGYTVGERRQNQFVFGYQYKQLKFEESDATTEIKLQGPTIGFNFRF